jgi:hypothetical protein
VWRVFLEGVFLQIIGNQIMLCFWKGLAIEAGGLGDTTAFRALPVAISYVNLDDYDLRITREYGFTLITHDYVPLLSITRQCILP